MQKSWHDIVIALAGAVQAISVVEQLAKTGYLRSVEYETAVCSLFQREPENTEAVFGGAQNLGRGFEVLDELLCNHRDPKNGDMLRYMLGVIHLQRRLAKRSDMLFVLSNRLEKAEMQAKHFSPSHDNVASSIADIYSDTISKFHYRIQVSGEYSFLHQARVANQVRTLLLAAIRAITLWRQVGGSRWQILLHRSSLIKTNEALLNEHKKTFH